MGPYLEVNVEMSPTYRIVIVLSFTVTMVTE